MLNKHLLQKVFVRFKNINICECSDERFFSFMHNFMWGPKESGLSFINLSFIPGT